MQIPAVISRKILTMYKYLIFLMENRAIAKFQKMFYFFFIKINILIFRSSLQLFKIKTTTLFKMIFVKRSSLPEFVFGRQKMDIRFIILSFNMVLKYVHIPQKIGILDIPCE